MGRARTDATCESVVDGPEDRGGWRYCINSARHSSR
jgi:peptide methionine sulfoxide reductase MsrB